MAARPACPDGTNERGLAKTKQPVDAGKNTIRIAKQAASWFEPALACLLTMRVRSYCALRAFATCSAVTKGAALPQELRM